MKSLKEMLKNSLREAAKISEKGWGPFSRAELNEIMSELERTNNKNIMIKGSRFTLGEKLQFTKVT
jgi:hypothetical protein